MTNYITKDDLLDDKLKGLSKDADFANATSFFNKHAFNLQLLPENIKTNPFPYECRRALEYWIYVEICRRNLGTNLTTAANGSQTDWYKEKLKEYEKCLGKALTECTYNVILGIVTFDGDHSELTTAIERA